MMLDIWILAARDEYAPIRRSVIERFIATCAETKDVRVDAYRRYIAPHLDECSLVMGKGEDQGICQAITACLEKKALEDVREINNKVERARYKYAVINVLRCTMSRCDVVNRHILAEVAGQMSPTLLQNISRLMRRAGEEEESIRYY